MNLLSLCLSKYHSESNHQSIQEILSALLINQEGLHEFHPLAKSELMNGPLTKARHRDQLQEWTI